LSNRKSIGSGTEAGIARVKAVHYNKVAGQATTAKPLLVSAD